jgi:predicted ATPase
MALERLSRHLPLLTSAMIDAPARQQTLQATLEWSVDLLDSSTQGLFRHAAVFAGGWTLEAAEGVAASPDAARDCRAHRRAARANALSRAFCQDHDGTRCMPSLSTGDCAGAVGSGHPRAQWSVAD